MKVKVYCYTRSHSRVKVKKTPLTAQMYISLLREYRILTDYTKSLCEEYASLGCSESTLIKNQQYYTAFIEYMNLIDDFQYFKDNAHEVQDPDLPFPFLTL